MQSELKALAERVMALTGAAGENRLDVLCEVALFKPGTIYNAVRANRAGTKVASLDNVTVERVVEGVGEWN